MMKRARRLWLNLHLTLGITVGALFVLLGLTGSLLTFYQEVDRLLNPEIRSIGVEKRPKSIQAIADKIKQDHPDRPNSWRIEMPLSDDASFTLRYYHPKETAGKTFAPLMVTLDPSTLQETSCRFWGDYFVTWVYDLHYTLLLDQNGKTIVGLSGLVIVISLASGVYLWWPSRRRLITSLLPFLRPGPVRMTYDLHTRGGLYGLVILLGLALTGTGLALPHQSRFLLSYVTSVEDLPRPSVRATSIGVPVIDLDQAIAVASEIFPGAELRWVETGGGDGKPISIRFHQPHEPSRRFPKSQVWIDPYSGEVLAVWDPENGPMGNSVLDWLHPLHNGEAFGIIGRWVVFVIGLLPSLLFATGLLRWRQKRISKNLNMVFSKEKR